MHKNGKITTEKLTLRKSNIGLRVNPKLYKQAQSDPIIRLVKVFTFNLDIPALSMR